MRFSYDQCLLKTLVDWWRLETQMFHLSCGEMVPTIQDMTFLIVFPYAGFPLVAHDVPATWCMEFLARFHGVLLPNTSYKEFNSTHGPSLKWIY